jgi:sporulation protein YhbH
MAVKDLSEDWGLSDRGEKDAERHRRKIDDAIRKNVKDVISEESIITKKRGRKVRIPVKGLKDYQFIYDNNKKGKGGVGQGEGEDGDVIARRDKSDRPGKPGNQPGDDTMEVEVNIDYLIDIMFQDLGLPWIDEKTKIEKLVPSGWKFDSISKKGIIPRLHKKRTFVETLKRTMAFVGEIMRDTNSSEEDARIALSMAKGDINDAIDIINEGKLDRSHEAAVIIDDTDLRYKQIENDVVPHSNAVVIAMMDVSGSMTLDKKYLARSMLFWMVEFLKKTYDNVDIKFIQHTTEASVVDEETFFHKVESGGTYCWTAIDKAIHLIETEYPVDEWNVYCVYISDGEDFDPSKTVRYVENLVDMKINMFGYCEIDTDEDNYGWKPDNTLIKDIERKWKFKVKQVEGTNFYRNDEKHILLSIIRGKQHIFPALQHFLFEPNKK